MRTILQSYSKSKVSLAVQIMLTIGLPCVSYASDAGASTRLIVVREKNSSDANLGANEADAIRTIRRALQLVDQDNNSTKFVIEIGAGTYHCRGKEGEIWVAKPNVEIVIRPEQLPPSPAFTSATSSTRPIFTARDASGAQCSTGSWLTVQHQGNDINLTITGLSIQHYRGGVSLVSDLTVGDPSADAGYVEAPQGALIDNMVFERIGNLYTGTSTPGKAAILLQNTSGSIVSNSYFHHIRNCNPNTDLNDYCTVDETGLIHAIYISRFSSNLIFDNNVFHGGTGTAVKISHFSNGNEFKNNKFSYFDGAVNDRWCGAKIGDSCPGGFQCPSWNNRYRLGLEDEGNIASGMPGDVCVWSVKPGNECHLAPEYGGFQDRFYYGNDVLESCS